MTKEYSFVLSTILRLHVRSRLLELGVLHLSKFKNLLRAISCFEFQKIEPQNSQDNTFFFSKNIFCKSVEAEAIPKIKSVLRTC